MGCIPCSQRSAPGAVLSSSPNFYILDEPTNHLDMETIEALAKALNKFRVRRPPPRFPQAPRGLQLGCLSRSPPAASRAQSLSIVARGQGGIILVSHDECFIRLVCHELWVCENATVTRIEGGFDQGYNFTEAVNFCTADWVSAPKTGLSPPKTGGGLHRPPKRGRGGLHRPPK